MQFMSNKISTGKGKSFDELVRDYKASKEVVKTASTKEAVKTATKEKDEADSSGQPEAEGSEKFNNDPYKDPKVKAESAETVKKAAEQDEADSSGQLKVEPLHQKGESTTMPKNGPNGKKEADVEKTDDEEKEAVVEKTDEEEKEATTDESKKEEEKEATTDESKKEASGKCDCGCDNCPECECKSCSASADSSVKEAGKLPDALKEHQFKAKEDKEDTDESGEKEASSRKFVKVANLDSKSKTWLNEYWKNLYPPEYVDAMLSDK